MRDTSPAGAGLRRRVLVHDYSGHPFQAQLTRELARRGHEARHVYSTSFQTPKGNLVRQPEDPETFSITGLTLKEPFAKDSFVKRRGQEIEFGKLVAGEIATFRPDIVISSNAPLDCQRMIWRACDAQGCARVFWLQDIYSEAIHRIMSRKIPGPGHLVGWLYTAIEVRLLRKSDHIVAISDGFYDFLDAQGIPRAQVSVVENWAPLSELTPAPRDNAFAAEHMSAGRPRILYSGTLGLKHNPDHLLAIAEGAPEADVYVFSEGAIADRLAAQAAAKGLANLQVRPWVAFAQLAEALSAADILVVLLEEDAGVFSVPSKVLSYACIGRPILGSIPEANLARQIITENGLGRVAVPAEPAQLVAYARDLLADPAARAEMGANARAYAERTFDITRIGDRFEEILGRLGRAERAAEQVGA